METLLPYGVGSVLLLAIAIWVAKRFFGHAIDDLSKWFLRLFRRRASRNRLLARRALRQYRRAVQQNYALHRLGFVQGKREGGAVKTLVSVRDIYVPLQAKLDGQRRNVYEWMRQQERIVVVGPPGAGKSMLLKNSMLLWAEGEDATARLPVFVELHRCNANQDTLEALIEKELIRNQLKRGQDFVRSALDEGDMAVMFDGLDEVGKDDQNRVNLMLKDFASAYSGCKVVVTCRDAHYHGQLEEQFVHRVEVTDFDDASIRSFLLKWKDTAGQPMPEETADRLFGDLQKSQQLMRLAASPLLLTMIAYLQTEVLGKANRSLPNSRPAFYEMAIGHLLRRDPDLDRHGSLSLYEPDEKKIVLQRLALSLQEAPADRPDRRSIERGELVTLVQALLPDLNRAPQEASAIIDEIIQRSQLLVRLDSDSIRYNYSTRYAFRHLTLQEYLAAIELADKPEELLTRYLADPDAWRETVKLWCAASGRDCTDLVMKIFEGDEGSRMLALECLAEATRIRDTFARQLISESVQLVLSPGTHERAIVKAFGTVAADPRPRGVYVFDLLADLAQGQAPGRATAMKALAETRVPRAASLLASMADDSDARDALRSMGEKAIPALQTRAEQGRVDAVDDLAVVGTPAAAVALARFLSQDNDVAKRAAWRLASLTSNPAVEAGLRASSLELPASIQTLPWIWAPFAKGEAPRFLAVMGRIGYLLNSGDETDIPEDMTAMDPRFAIPVGMVADPLPPLPDEPPADLLRKVARVGRLSSHVGWQSISDVLADIHDYKSPSVLNLFEAIMRVRGLTPFQRWVTGFLDPPAMAEATRKIFIRPIRVTKEDWTAVTVDSPEPRLLSAINWTLISVATVGAFIVGFIRALGTAFGFWPWGPAWLSWIALGGTAIGLLLLGLIVVSEFISWIDDVLDALFDFLDDFWIAGTIVIAIGVLWLIGTLGSSGTLALVSFASWIGWPWALAATVTTVLVCGLLTLIVKEREQKAANPLRPLHALALKPALAGTSIIGDRPPATAEVTEPAAIA
jgi:energy-coupling factor transporter ATP-binding protein EcfA2